MKDILTKIFKGMIAYEESWDGEKYARQDYECYVEACDGNEIDGALISLFAHWDNDIQTLAPHYGLALRRNAESKLYIDTNVPPPPSPEHYWSEDSWNAPSENGPAEASPCVI